MTKRPYSQDFSEATCGRITDSSFAAACDVNNIVRHYEQTGIDPFVERKILAQGGDASTTSFDSAMRAKAELDSAFHSLPEAERLQHDNNAMAWYEHLATQQAAEIASDELSPSPEAPADPPPEDSTELE